MDKVVQCWDHSPSEPEQLILKTIRCQEAVMALAIKTKDLTFAFLSSNIANDEFSLTLSEFGNCKENGSLTVVLLTGLVKYFFNGDMC